MTDNMAMIVQAKPTHKAEYFMPIMGIRAANAIDMILSEPLAILGTVVATVARKFVPNCSAAMVTNIAQNPTEIPSTKIHQYNDRAELKGKSK
jgi:hypothetical protein